MPDSAQETIQNQGSPSRKWRRLGVWAVLFLGLFLYLSHSVDDRRLRRDLRLALGSEKGDEGIQPRAHSVKTLPPIPSEVDARIRSANPDRVKSVIVDHFSALVKNKDWHVMSDRIVLRRIRAVDIATSLGLVGDVKPQLELLEQQARQGVEYYSDLDTTSPQPALSIIRDRQFHANALRLEQAARAALTKNSKP